MNDAAPVPVPDSGEAVPDPGEPTEPQKFIPVSRTDVIDALLVPEYWRGEEEQALAGRVFHKIGCLRQHRSAVMLNELSDIYDPFNPDDETVNQYELNGEQRAEQRRVFSDRLQALITGANYHELTNEGLEEVLSNASPDGVHVEVDFSEFDVKLIFFRGEDIQHRSKRDVMRAYLKRIYYTVPIYKRLFLALKFKPEDVRVGELMAQHGITEQKARKKLSKIRKMLPPYVSTDHIYLKMFKDIPRYDVEMLFPNIRVKMKYRDKLQLGGSALFGTLTYLLGTATKLVVAVALSPLMLAVALLSGFGGIIYAQVRNIFVTRDRYRMQLAQSLYFQNLANNQGALAVIVDDAEEEDVKEEVLLYAHLLGGPFHISQLDAIGEHISKFLTDKFGVNVQFDVYDALERLMASQIVRQSSTGELHVLSLADADRHLHNRWCRLVEH